MTDLIIVAEIRGTLLFELHAERAVFFCFFFIRKVRAILMSVCLGCAVFQFEYKLKLNPQFIVISLLCFVRKSSLVEFLHVVFKKDPLKRGC